MTKTELQIKVKRTMVFWITISLLVVIAIPSMILAIINGIWLIAVPCIAITVFGFYGLPIGWVSFAALKEQQNVVITITEEELYDISELAKSLGKSIKQINIIINRCISKRYLTGMKLASDGTKLVASKLIKTVQGKCNNCGAPLQPESKVCGHCNSAV